jgi:hypothetical protein
MLQRYQVSDKVHLCRRIQLFKDAALQFAIFVSKHSNHICLIPAFGPAFMELQSWPGTRFVGVYNQNASPIDIIEDLREGGAYWIRLEDRGDRVHYHRYKYPHNMRTVARNYLRRKKT